MRPLPEGKFVHGMDQRSLNVYAATVTVVSAMIATLLFVVLLLPMHILYTNGIAARVGYLIVASIHNFVLELSCGLFRDVLHVAVRGLLVATSSGL